MKKLISAASIISLLLLSGCYEDSGDVTLRINLGNIPVAYQKEKSFIDRFLMLFSQEVYAQAAPGNVVRVHIIAIQGETITATGSYDVPGDTDGNSVEIRVPAGKNVDIVVVGENSAGVGEYFGFTSIDIQAGEAKSVTVIPYTQYTIQSDNSSWYDKLGMDIVYGEISNTIKWNSIGFHVKHHLYEEEWNGEQYVMIKRYEGYGLSAFDPNGGYHYILYIEFKPLGVLSEPFDLNEG